MTVSLRRRGSAVGSTLRKRVRPATIATVATVTALATLGIPTLLASPASALGTTLYVAQGGSDTSNTCGVAATPCATVSYALTQAAAGATINVSGTIADHININRDVTITGVNAPAGSPAVLDGASNGRVVQINAGNVTFSDLTIQHGTTPDNNGGGGILYAGFGTETLALDSVTMTANVSGNNGGGALYALGGVVDINNSTFNGNSATNPGNGGAILSLGASVQLTDSTVAGNSAFGSGGGISVEQGAAPGQLTVQDSTISGNNPGNTGGGIFIDTGSQAVVTNSTIFGNANAGLWNIGALTLTDSTVADNGIGILNQYGSGGASIGATIVAENGTNCDQNVPITSVGYNYDDGGACGFTQATDLHGGDVGLGFYGNYGGPTQTLPLSIDSPAANVIPAGTALNSVQVCQRTDATGTVGPTPVEGGCSIGAVEARGVVTPMNTFYVSGSGSDATTNTCASPSTPCATVTYALTKPNFSLPVPATIEVSGTVHDHVTLPGSHTVIISGSQAPPGSPAILDGSSSGRVITVSPGTSAELDHLTIRNGDVASGDGGGIYNNNGRLTLNHVVVDHNTANDGGGGLFAVGGNTAISYSTISNNTAGGCTCTPVGNGGGISAYTASPMTIDHTSIVGNTALGFSGGGGVYSDAPLDITDSTISGNSAAGGGGGAFFDGSSTVAVVNSTIANNTAGSNAGGGVFTSGSLTVSGSTIASNGGSAPDGVELSAGSASFAASIISDNGTTNCGYYGGHTSGIVSAGYNLDTDGSCAFHGTGDIHSVAANLGTLSNNGGATLTMLPSTASPAAFVVPGNTTLNSMQVCSRTDQRGVPGPTSGHTTCSMGAVEVGGATIAPAFASSASQNVAWGDKFSFPVTTSGTPIASVSVSPATPLPVGVVLTDNGDGTATLIGSVTHVGTFTFTLIASNGTAPDATQSYSIVAGKRAQEPLEVFTPNGPFGTPLPLTIIGGSGTGTLSLAVSDGTATGCAISSGSLSATSVGTCFVTATKAADSNYVAASSPNTVITFGKADQTTLTVTSTSGVDGVPLTLTSTGGSGTGAVTWTAAGGTSGGASGCALSGTGPFQLNVTSAGTCRVYATKAADANYNTINSAVTVVTFTAASQAALTVTSTSGTVSSPLTLTTTGGSGTGTVTFSVTNGTATGCAISGSSLSTTSSGTCVVTATKAADANYSAVSSVPTTVTFAAQNQAGLIVTSLQGTYLTPLSLTTSGGSGTGAVSYAAHDGTATGCVVTGTTLSTTSPGTCSVTATKAADADYSAISSVAATVTFLAAHQAALTVTSTTGSAGTPLALTTSGGSGSGSVTFTVTNGTATGCQVSASTLTAATTGTCTVTATKAADADYDAVSSPATTVTFGKENQATLAVTSTSGTYLTALTLTTSGGSGTGAVTYTVANGTATGCMQSDAVLSSSSAGTCLVTATRAGDANYNPISSAMATVTLAKADQSALTVTSRSGTYLTPLTLTTSGGSGAGAVSYTASAGSAGCVVAGTTLTSASAGTCFVDATKAADSNYNAASSGSWQVTIAKAAQSTLTVASTSGPIGTPLTLTTSGGSGSGAITFTAADRTATGCSVVGSTLTASTAGTCAVTATKAGDTDFNATSSATTTETFGKQTQAALTVTSTSGIDLTPLTLTTSGGSGTGAVTFSVSNGTAAGCALTGSELSSTSAGTCTVTANKAGDATFDPISSIPTTVTFAAQTQAPLTVTSTTGTLGTPLALATTGGTGTGAITYVADPGTATGCAVSTSSPYTLSATSAGTCIVTATKAGDGNYKAVVSPPTTVTLAALAAQKITFTSTAPTGAVVGGPDYAIAVTGGGSGNPVTLSLDSTSRGCALTGSTVTFAHAGTCVIDANQAGNTHYLAAPQVQQTFGVARATQTIGFTSTVPVGAVVGGDNYTVTATGGHSGNPVTFVLDASSTGCDLSGATVTFPHAGTCVIDANQAGNTDYSAAAQAQQRIVVGATSQTITFTSTPPAQVVTGGPSYQLSATGGNSGNPVTFALDSISTGCDLSGSTVTFPHAGTCVIDANQAGNTDYTAAATVQQRFGVDRTPQTITLTSTAPTGAVVGSAHYTVTATGGLSGNPVTFALGATSTGCDLGGSTVTFPHAGTCVIDANQAGNADVAPAVQAQQVFTIGKASQAIAFTSVVPSGVAVRGPNYTVTATGGGSGNPVTFALDPTSTGCVLTGATLSFPSAGICEVDANQAGNSDYLAAAPADQVLTIGPAKLTTTKTSLHLSKHVVSYGHEQKARITVTVSSTGNKTVTGKVVVHAGSRRICTIALSPSSRGTGSCALTPSKLKVGAHAIVATYAGDATLAPSSSTRSTLKVVKSHRHVRLTITGPRVLPSATIGRHYSFTLRTHGGPRAGHYIWSLASGSPRLPRGLTLAKGVISGTPTRAGTFTIRVQVDDSATATLTIRIRAA